MNHHLTTSMRHYPLLFLLIFALATSPFNPIYAAEATDLVKCPDFTAVYYFGEDAQRYVFQNERTFFSWYDDFSEVRTISCDDLSELPIGGVVHYQAGTRLLKIPSVATVYAVESNGTLRAIKNEERAKALYGDDWADRVDDLSEAFFPQYELGEELEDEEVPEGTVIESGDGNLFRMEVEEAVEIEDLLDDRLRSVIDKFKLEIETLEANLGIEIALTRASERAQSVLEEVRAKLKTRNIEIEVEVEIEFDELEVEVEVEIDVDIEEEDDADDDVEDEDVDDASVYNASLFSDDDLAYVVNRHDIFSALAEGLVDDTLSEGAVVLSSQMDDREDSMTIQTENGMEIQEDWVVDIDTKEIETDMSVKEIWASTQATLSNTPSDAYGMVAESGGKIHIDEGTVELEDADGQITASFNFEQDVEKHIQDVYDTDVPEVTEEQVIEACEEEGVQAVENFRVFSKIVSVVTVVDEETVTKWYKISAQKIKGYDCQTGEYYSDEVLSYTCSETKNGLNEKSESGFQLKRK